MKDFCENRNVRMLIEEFDLKECSTKKESKVEISQEIEKWPKMNEIKNFTISYNGIYWLHFKDIKEPIVVSYSQLSFLLAKECLKGKALKDDNWIDGISFKKSTIIVYVWEDGKLSLCDFLYDGVIFMNDEVEFISFQIVGFS